MVINLITLNINDLNCKNRALKGGDLERKRVTRIKHWAKKGAY